MQLSPPGSRYIWHYGYAKRSSYALITTKGISFFPSWFSCSSWWNNLQSNAAWISQITTIVISSLHYVLTRENNAAYVGIGNKGYFYNRRNGKRNRQFLNWRKYRWWSELPVLLFWFPVPLIQPIRNFMYIFKSQIIEFFQFTGHVNPFGRPSCIRTDTKQRWLGMPIALLELLVGSIINNNKVQSQETTWKSM